MKCYVIPCFSLFWKRDEMCGLIKFSDSKTASVDNSVLLQTTYESTLRENTQEETVSLLAWTMRRESSSVFSRREENPRASLALESRRQKKTEAEQKIIEFLHHLLDYYSVSISRSPSSSPQTESRVSSFLSFISAISLYVPLFLSDCDSPFIRLIPFLSRISRLLLLV